MKNKVRAIVFAISVFIVIMIALYQFASWQIYNAYREGGPIRQLNDKLMALSLEPSLKPPNWMHQNQKFDFKVMEKDAIEFDGLKVTPFKLAGGTKRIVENGVEYTGHVESDGEYYFLRVVNPKDKTHNLLCDVEILDEKSKSKTGGRKVVQEGSLIYPNSETDIMGSGVYVKLLSVKEDK